MRLSVLAAFALVLAILTPPANAGGAATCQSASESAADAGASGLGFFVNLQQASVTQCTIDTTGASLPAGQWHSAPACGLGGDQTCSGESATCSDGSTMMSTWYQTEDGDRLMEDASSCPTDEQPEEDPQPTEADYFAAFQTIPLPKSVLHVQPADGRTLVNFATNFYTVQPPFTATATVLEQAVEFRIRPTTFTWHFGDGTSTTSTTPGAAYPDLQITHTYADKGEVQARVDTTYSADWRVGQGAWTPVNGTVTIAGDPVGLTVLTASPQLVG